MADIMKERFIKHYYHQSDYIISHFDITDFLILKFSTASLNYHPLNYKFICWSSDTDELWNNTGSLTYLLDLFYLSVPENHDGDPTSTWPRWTGQISANIFSIHDVLLHSYWLLIQMIINEAHFLCP